MMLFIFAKLLKAVKQQDDVERDRKDDRKMIDELKKVVISQADLTKDEKVSPYGFLLLLSDLVLCLYQVAVRASSNKMVAQPGQWNFGLRQDTFVCPCFYYSVISVTDCCRMTFESIR